MLRKFDTRFIPLVVMGLIILGVIGFRILSPYLVEENLDERSVESKNSEIATATKQSDTSLEETISVFVSGAVAKPGVYELCLGKRIQDAIDSAGGFSAHAHLDALNRATLLCDEMQIYVPTKTEIAQSSFDPLEMVQSNMALEKVNSSSDLVEGVSGASTKNSAKSSSKPPSKNGVKPLVNINTAGSAELETLPGVGPATAQKIIDERSSGGKFSSVDELIRVKGIGEKKLAEIREYATVK